MKRYLLRLALTLLLLLAACGEPLQQNTKTAPTSPSPSPSSLPSESPSPTPEPTPTDLSKTYSDPAYGFSLKYPTDFQTETFDPSVQMGQLRRLRFFDKRFLGEYPAGQIELAVYEKDANSLETWLAKHSGSDRTKPGIYYEQPSSAKDPSVNGRPAISFDFDGGPEVGAVHVVGFFSGELVIALEWFGTESYSPSIQAVFDQMLESYKD